jgi:DNA invertase Pin-like site-specific DNA recombinase
MIAGRYKYEWALTRERVQTGLAAARRRGKRGGQPVAVEPEKLEAVIAALNVGVSKAGVCQTFGIPRSTLIDTLARVGWTGSAAAPA